MLAAPAAINGPFSRTCGRARGEGSRFSTIPQKWAGSSERRTFRDWKIPDDAAASAVASPAGPPRRQRARPAGGRGPLRPALQPESHGWADVGFGRVSEVAVMALSLERLDPPLASASRYRRSKLATIRSKLNCDTAARAAAPSAHARTGLARTDSVAAASARASPGGTRSPVRGAAIRSGTSPTAVATIGRPAAIASINALGRGLGPKRQDEDSSPGEQIGDVGPRAEEPKGGAIPRRCASASIDWSQRSLSAARF